jgi:hypothetical protein
MHVGDNKAVSTITLEGSMLEAFRGEILALLRACLDRREARVMLAQAQLHLVQNRLSEVDRDQFWKALLKDLKLAPQGFAASDVFKTAMADVTLYSIRCGRDSYLESE